MAAQIRVTERKEPEKITTCRCPTSTACRWIVTWRPHLVLPLLTARGCYFGKCAFCNVGYGEPETFSQLRAEHLADQMMSPPPTYGTTPHLLCR